MLAAESGSVAVTGGLIAVLAGASGKIHSHCRGCNVL